MGSREYLGCAETAKLVRQALRESFPGVKFSVRSSVYAGGGSITVRWQDGPISKAVDAITGRFSGAYFDGMTDYKGSRYHLLDGRSVRFGADFIFVERQQSRALVERIAVVLNARGWKTSVQGSEERAYLDGGNGIINHIPPYAVAEAEEALEGGMVAKPSPTLLRVQCTGDDGYGANTVGPYYTGGNQGYAAVAS